MVSEQISFEPTARGLASKLRETRCRCALLRKWLRVNDEEAYALVLAALTAAYQRGVLVNSKQEGER